MSGRTVYVKQLCNAPEGKYQKEVGSDMANKMEKQKSKVEAIDYTGLTQKIAYCNVLKTQSISDCLLGQHSHNL